MEVSFPNGGLTSDQMSHFQPGVTPLFQEDLSAPIGVTWKPGCSCVALFVCPSYPAVGPIS